MTKKFICVECKGSGRIYGSDHYWRICNCLKQKPDDKKKKNVVKNNNAFTPLEDNEFEMTNVICLWDSGCLSATEAMFRLRKLNIQHINLMSKEKRK